MKRYRSTFMFDGKQYERTSTKSQREADKKAAELKRNLENGEVGVCKKCGWTILPICGWKPTKSLC